MTARDLCIPLVGMDLQNQGVVEDRQPRWYAEGLLASRNKSVRSLLQSAILLRPALWVSVERRLDTVLYLLVGCYGEGDASFER
jgi:hypothetical protein